MPKKEESPLDIIKKGEKSIKIKGRMLEEAKEIRRKEKLRASAVKKEKLIKKGN